MDLLAQEAFVLGLIRYVIFLFSTACHEASHALVAKLGGDLTAFHGGQVSLSPLPHIRREPFGMVIVPLLSLFSGGGVIGWASAPYDPAWQQRHPRRAAWMSLAGPAANLALVLAATAVISAGRLAGVFEPPAHWSSTHVVESVQSGFLAGAATALSILFSMNLLLGAFNLIPIPPLDGFSAPGIFMTERAARRYARLGDSLRPYSWFGLLVCWRLFEHIYGPIFAAGIRMLYPELRSR
ncbi:MAG TPA: site-2 protease family protein [Bryobacteraceae bacterium]|nr:site-2 protease family protein [Bryobacteraceae bacterium]